MDFFDKIAERKGAVARPDVVMTPVVMPSKKNTTLCVVLWLVGANWAASTIGDIFHMNWNQQYAFARIVAPLTFMIAFLAVSWLRRFINWKTTLGAILVLFVGLLVWVASIAAARP